MKTLKIFVLAFIMSSYAIAQTLPTAPNQTQKGLREGKWVIWFTQQWKPTTIKDSVVFYRIISYQKGKPTGIVNDFYLSGKKQFEGKILDDTTPNEEIMDGLAVWYYENGQKSSEVTYVKGKKEGQEKSYYESGKLEGVFQFINGVGQGAFTTYYENGNKKVEGEYKDGERNSVWILYYENGQKSSKVPHVSGKREGRATDYDENGKLTQEIDYENDVEKESDGDKVIAEIKQAYQDYTDKKYATALPVFEKYVSVLVEIYQKEEENEKIVELLQIIITCYEQTGQQTKADKLKPSLVILKESSSEWAKIDEQGGKLYQEGKYEQAIQILEKAKTQAEKEFGKEHSSYATSLNNLALLYKSQGLYAKAEPLFVEAKEISAKVLGKQHPSYATSCNNLAALYQDQGLYAKAEPLYLEAKEIRAKALGKENPDYAASLNNLAVLYQSQGLYAKAEPLYIEAKEIFVKVLGKEHTSYATSLGSLALLYNAQGLYTKAEPLFVEAKEIYAKALGREHPDYAGSCNNLALLYDNQGLYAKAESLYLEAKEIKAKVLGKEHPDYALSLNNLAGLYRNQGLYAKAEPLYIEAKEIRAKALSKEHPSYATSCNDLGGLYDSQGLYAKTEPLYIEAKEIRAKVLGKEHPDYAISLNNLAALYYAQGLYAKAAPLLIESKDIALKSLLNNFSNLSEGEKKQFFDTNFFYFENFYGLIATILQKEPTYKGLPNLLQNAFDLQLQTKGLLLAETQKMKKRILSSGDTELIAKYEAWGALKNTIAKAYNLSVADRAKQGLAMPKLESEANELEKQLSARSEDFKRAFTPPTVTYQDIQKHLKEGEVAIEMIRTKYKNQETDEVDTAYLVLVLTKTALFPVLLKNGKDLESKILKKYRNNIKFKMVDTVSYRAFWQPIAEKLAGAKKVYFSPDGAYNSLNINTLFNPTTKKYIVDEYDLSILTNLKEMIAQKKPNATKKANLFGRPAYKMSKDEHEDNRREVERGETSETESSFNITQMGFSDLVGTEVEVKGIDSVLRKNTWQTELILGKQAIEERVKKVKNPAILHIATHGYFIPSDGKSVANAMLNSGIVLAGVSSEKGANSEDGVLTAYEASSLDLDETDLVVLSACETGLGDIKNGEGVYGLQRGFKVAGAKAVIMSLWKVDDTATQELMNTFYSLWLSGKSKKEAFKATQLQLKAKYKFPFYWGAFVMVGE